MTSSFALTEARAPLSEGRLIAAIALAALVVRALAIALFADFDPATAQLWEYGHQAACAVATSGPLCLYKFTDGFAQPYPSAFMPPLLSYVWWVLFTLFGVSSLAIGVFLAFNALIGAACTALLFRLARQIGLGQLAAGAGALTLALYPSFVFVTATTHNTNVAVFFFLALAVLAVDLARRPHLAGAVLVGLVAGLAVLNRSEMLIIAPAMIAAAAIAGRAVRPAILAMACMALVMSPWIARNHALFGAIIPTAQSSGYNLWKGFNPYADGSGNATEANPAFIAEREAVRAATPAGPRFEPQVEAQYIAKAKAYVARMSLADHLALASAKAAMLWTLDWTDSEITHQPIYIASWAVTNVLALYGLLLLWGVRASLRWTPIVMIVLILGGITAASMATFVHARYRMHIEPFLFILVGAALAHLWALVQSSVLKTRDRPTASS